MTRCVHMNFKADCRVGGLTNGDGGPVTGYTMEIHVTCADCGQPFRFRGHRHGSSPHEPMLSADGLELRAPIEPALAPEILGRPIVKGNA